MTTRRTLSVFAHRWPLVGLALALGGCTTEGPVGPEGPEGPEGPPGTQGEQGPAGEDGADSLIESTALDRGDADCPFGGVMLEIGVDDGSDGGAAGDGALQAGEIDATEYLCNALQTVVGYEPPGGPRGDGVIDASGGDSTATHSGGGGGQVDLSFLEGSAGGHLKVFATGEADATFTMPDVTASIDLGPRPLLVTSGTTTLWGVDTATEVADGEYYLIRASTDGRVYRRDSVNGDTMVTGVSVSSGATLEIEGDDWAESHYRHVRFPNDVFNAGTITTTLLPGYTDPTERGGLALSCANFASEPGSVVDLSGQDASAGDYGGEAGRFTLVANGGLADLEYGHVGSIYNEGTIDASGGASTGQYAGKGGYVNLYAADRLYNSGGIVTASSTSTFYGGNAGQVRLEGGEGLYNSGAIDASAATTGIYGAGGVEVLLTSGGEVRNTGDIAARGGSQTDTGCGSDCSGGRGGTVTISATGPGGVITSGDLTVTGGDAAGTQASAGTGGRVEIHTEVAPGWFAFDQVPGSVAIAGDIDLRGGDSPHQGGYGGMLKAWVDAGDWFDGQEVTLYGYDRIVLDGGDAGPSGGNGGPGGLFRMTQQSAELLAPSGGVINYADIHARGGEVLGPGTWGGNGGKVSMWTDGEFAFRGGAEVALNAGDVDVSGGGAPYAGGLAGCFTLFGANWSENSGDLVARGGDSTGTGAGLTLGGWPACVASVGIYSSLGPATNTGAVDTHGGNASGSLAGSGGEGGGVEIVGATVDNAGPISTVGGDSGNKTGGSGGKVYLRSFEDVTVNTGTFDTSGGAGSVPGSPGAIWIDGLQMPAP